MCTRDSHPDGEAPVGSPDKKAGFCCHSPVRLWTLPQPVIAALTEQETDSRESMPATSPVQSCPVNPGELLLAGSRGAQNYNPEIRSQAKPRRGVAKKMRKAEREKRKLHRECSRNGGISK